MPANLLKVTLLYGCFSRFLNCKNGTKVSHIYLKWDSHLPKKKIIICFNDSPSKMMKNAFYFILKALFILKILKFLSRLFVHVEKTVWLET